MQVLPQGGVQRRVGTQYIYNKAHSDDAPSSIVDIGEGSRVIPFTYSKTEKYLFLFSTDTSSKVICNMYNVEENSWFAFPVFSAYAGHAQPRIDDTNSYFLDPLNDATTLSEMQYAQKGNVLLLTHGNFPPILIRRISKNEFACSHWYVRDENPNLTRPDFNETTPFRQNTDSNHTMTLSGTLTLAGAVTVTSSIAFFSDEHIGSYMAVKDSAGANLGYLQITAFTSTTIVTGVVTKTLGAVGTGATTQWAEAYWSHHRGWPRTCTFAEGRLVFAGSPSYPDATWFTQTDDIFEWSNTAVLDPGTALVESDPGILFPSTREVNEITWIHGGNRNVLVGTRGAEYSVTRLSGLPIDVTTGEAITKFAMQSSHGSEYVQPAAVDESTVFMQRGSRKVRNMIFDSRIEAYKSIDKTFLAEHITRRSLETGSNLSKITQMTYQELDNKILWAIDNNGKLIYATLDSESGVTAWAHANLGGEGVDVQSIAALPSKNGTTDELYLLVKRDIDGGTKVYLEKLGNDFLRDSLNVDSDLRENQPVFMDCASVYRAHDVAGLYGKYSADRALAFDGGSDSGTLTGTTSFADQEMKLIAGSYITYTLDAFFFGNKGSLDLECRIDDMNLAQTLFSSYNSAGGAADKVHLHYQTAPRAIVLDLYNTGGTILTSLSVSLGVNTGDSELTPLSIRLGFNVLTGDNTLTVNDVSDSNTVTGTMGTSADEFIVGADIAGATPVQNSFFSNIAIYTITKDVQLESYKYQTLTDQSGTLNQTIKHLDYLEGQSVQVVADGNYLGDYSVASGAITVTNTPPTGGWKTIIVGLGYSHLVAPNEIEAGGNLGNSQGEVKRIDRIIARFNKTASCSHGDTESNQSPIIFRDPDAPMGNPIGLYTGDKILDFDGDIDRNATVVLTGDAPLPCNITCIIVRGTTNG